jgi:hypothetical protein
VGCPVYYKMFSNVPDLYPLEVVASLVPAMPPNITKYYPGATRTELFSADWRQLLVSAIIGTSTASFATLSKA